jgi:FlaA1/EpsC-like NDP-sugar epimerase
MFKIFNYKTTQIIIHDLFMTFMALVISLSLRFEGQQFAERIVYLPYSAIYILFAGVVYFLFKLYNSKWRFASIIDLISLAKVSLLLTLCLMAVDRFILSELTVGWFFGNRFLVIYFFLQMAMLGSPRIVYRYWKDSRAKAVSNKLEIIPTLIVGRTSEVDILLRQLETSTLKTMRPYSILSLSAKDKDQIIRGVKVRGTVDDIESQLVQAEIRGMPIRKIVMSPTALFPENSPEKILDVSRKFGIPVLRMQTLNNLVPITLAPVEVEDLLLRSTYDIESILVSRFVAGKRFVVTGGGGSIGSEICRRLKHFGANSILILENSEPALHAILEELDQDGHTVISGHIADVRERSRIVELMSEFRPDIVFHSAALKHVPYLEKDWREGIKTNVFGSVNVAEAAIAAKAACVVMISTDKAIRPVSMLGATKRLAEIVTESMDQKSHSTRLISVRFGNVLGSNGSVVPKFKKQIANGGPITITHPDMMRYFMTMREACDLVLTSAAHASSRLKTEVNPSVYVLKMGQAVKVVDLAETMIRLSGFEPGKDIKIEYVGIRPGERLHEILFDDDESIVETGLNGVVAAQNMVLLEKDIKLWLSSLNQAIIKDDLTKAQKNLLAAVPSYTWGRPNSIIPD